MLKGWLWLFCEYVFSLNMFRWFPCVPQIRRECYSSIPTVQLKYQVGMWPRTGDLSHNLYPRTNWKAIYTHPLLWVHLKSRKQEHPRYCTHPVKKEKKIYRGKISTQKIAHRVHMPEITIPTRKGEKIAGEPLNKIENTRRKRRTLEYIWELKKYLFGGRLATRSLAEVCSLPGGLPNPLCTFQCSPTFLHFAFLSASCI